MGNQRPERFQQMENKTMRTVETAYRVPKDIILDKVIEITAERMLIQTMDGEIVECPRQLPPQAFSRLRS